MKKLIGIFILIIIFAGCEKDKLCQKNGWCYNSTGGCNLPMFFNKNGSVNNYFLTYTDNYKWNFFDHKNKICITNTINNMTDNYTIVSIKSSGGIGTLVLKNDTATFTFTEEK
jgi:hypothetical protein